jgi:hypothetical protein
VDLADTGLRRRIDDLYLHPRQRFAGRTKFNGDIPGGPARQERRGFGQTIAYQIGKPRLCQKGFNLWIEGRTANPHQLQVAAEEIDELAADLPVDQSPYRSYFADQAQCPALFNLGQTRFL